MLKRAHFQFFSSTTRRLRHTQRHTKTQTHPHTHTQRNQLILCSYIEDKTDLKNLATKVLIQLL